MEILGCFVFQHLVTLVTRSTHIDQRSILKNKIEEIYILPLNWSKKIRPFYSPVLDYFFASSIYLIVFAFFIPVEVRQPKKISHFTLVTLLGISKAIIGLLAFAVLNNDAWAVVVAQWVVRLPPTPEICGSNPVIGKLLSNICLLSIVLKRRK